MENHDSHINGVISSLVMLAAVFTTFTTYSYYKEDALASDYESEQASLEQTASALVSLRLMEQNQIVDMSSTTATTTEEEAIELE